MYEIIVVYSTQLAYYLNQTKIKFFELNRFETKLSWFLCAGIKMIRQLKLK